MTMADDLYRELGVPRGASEEDIRKAYRKLAKENHPDLNPANKAEAEARIKTINAAFGILGDAEKRRQYDAGMIDANGEPRRTHRAHAGAGRGSSDDFGFGDIFSDLFGRTGRAGPTGATHFKGQDVRYTLEVDFLEAANGAKKRVTLPDGGALDLTVPEGVDDGQVLRLRGKGGASPRGGERGDALVEIKVRPHADLKRQGNDVHSTVPVTLDEAILGGKIEVQTIHGRVALTLPKGTSSGSAFRMKGRGIRPVPGQAAGDHIVTTTIMMPAEIDDGLAQFIEVWRKTHAYDPGRRG